MTYDEDQVAALVYRAAEQSFAQGWNACNRHREAQFIAAGLPDAARIMRDVAEVEAAQFEAAEAEAAGLSH